MEPIARSAERMPSPWKPPPETMRTVSMGPARISARGLQVDRVADLGVLDAHVVERAPDLGWERQRPELGRGERLQVHAFDAHDLEARGEDEGGDGRQVEV